MEPNPHYSYKWSIGIALKLYKKYTRASKLVERLYGYTMPDMALWLATGNPLWTKFKTRIKAWDVRIEAHGLDYYTDVKQNEIEHIELSQKGEEILLELLDSREREVEH